eukprot:superscaffoldBa00000075_g1156
MLSPVPPELQQSPVPAELQQSPVPELQLCSVPVLQQFTETELQLSPVPVLLQSSVPLLQQCLVPELLWFTVPFNCLSPGCQTPVLYSHCQPLVLHSSLVNSRVVPPIRPAWCPPSVLASSQLPEQFCLYRHIGSAHLVNLLVALQTCTALQSCILVAQWSNTGCLSCLLVMLPNDYVHQPSSQGVCLRVPVLPCPVPWPLTLNSSS